MTAPPAGVSARRDWWVRPAVVLPVLGALLVVLALLTPQATDGRAGDPRLSAHLAGPLGARALRETAARLGWRTVLRDSTPTPRDGSAHVIHAVLDPPIAPTPAQVHRYLEAVRGGAALLLVLGDRGAFDDSLGVRHSRSGGVLDVATADSAGCGERGRDWTPMLWPDRQVHLYALRWPRGRPPGLASFAGVRMEAPGAARRVEETVAGFPYGRGRVVVVADPDLLRNDVVRRCEWGADVGAVRALEWLSAGGDQPRRTIEFDEFHHGFGPRASTTSVTRRFLATHPVGRTILQLALAALVLLLALAPRPLAPRATPRAERRDPLEQVDALANAYQQVGATRTATLRLLHGVRSRVEHAAGRVRSRSDEEFLTDVAAQSPGRAGDVELVREALRTSDARTTLPEVGAALRRIEESVTPSTSLTA